MAKLQPPPFNIPFIDQSGKMPESWQKYLLDNRLTLLNAAPVDAAYFIGKANADLTAARNLGLLASGYLKIAVALGIAVPSTVAVIPVADISGILPISKGGTGGNAAATSGGIVYGASGIYAVSAAGSAGYVLVSGGAGAPSWATVAAAVGHALLDGVIITDSVAAAVARGALVVGNNTPKWDRLLIGAANRVLRSDGTDATWAQVVLSTDVTGVLAVANGGTNLSSYTIGDLLYASAAGVIGKLTDVAVGQLLASGGAGAAPAYTAAPHVTGTMSADAGYAGGYVAKTGAYVIALTDYLVDCTSGTFNVTLPTAVGIQGRMFRVKNSGVGVITVLPDGAETIDGGASDALATTVARHYMSNGAGWIIL